MTELEEHIRRVNTKLQQLLKQHQAMDKERQELAGEVKRLTETRKKDLEQIEQLEQRVNILKSAAGQLNEPEKKVFEKNINQYIREIDKCIGLLSE